MVTRELLVLIVIKLGKFGGGEVGAAIFARAMAFANSVLNDS
jgi:hypothetical protein